MVILNVAKEQFYVFMKYKEWNKILYVRSLYKVHDSLDLCIAMYGILVFMIVLLNSLVWLSNVYVLG